VGACVLVQAEPPSSVAVQRDAPGSRPDDGHFVPLRGSARFSSVYRNGSKSRRGPVVVFSMPSPSNQPEVGVVAGRRVGNAVARNTAKRRLREAARRAPLSGNRAYVMVASEAVVDVAFDDLVECISAAAASSEQETP